MAPILYSLLALGFLLSTAYSRPAPGGKGGWPPHHPSPVHHPKQSPSPSPSPAPTPSPSPQVLTTQQLQALQPTLSGLAANTNVTLKYSTLGIGHQNYTCNGTAFVQTLPGSGATALLYDTTEFLKANPGEINTLSEDCNYEGCKYPGILHNLLGNHYFSESHVPIFNLSKAVPPLVLAGSKVGDVPAPSSEDIDWLLLIDANDGITQGLKEVYRIDTFNGKLANSSCSQVGVIQSAQYTAQYWFYD